MSVQAMAWAMEQRTGSVSRKAVLMALADRAGFDWKCWPSQATIAYNVELSERQVRRILDELEEAGLLGRRRRTDARGHRTSDMITLIPTGHHVRLVATDLPDIDAVLPDTGDHPYRTPMSGEPSVEPSVVEPIPTPPQAATAQDVDRLVKDFYEWVRKESGHKPVSWKVPQMKKLLEPFLAVWGIADLKQVLVTIHRQGEPFTRQVIERRLDGRARATPGYKQATVERIDNQGRDSVLSDYWAKKELQA